MGRRRRGTCDEPHRPLQRASTWAPPPRPISPHARQSGRRPGARQGRSSTNRKSRYIRDSLDRLQRGETQGRSYGLFLRVRSIPSSGPPFQRSARSQLRTNARDSYSGRDQHSAGSGRFPEGPRAPARPRRLHQALQGSPRRDEVFPRKLTAFIAGGKISGSSLVGAEARIAFSRSASRVVITRCPSAGVYFSPAGARDRDPLGSGEAAFSDAISRSFTLADLRVRHACDAQRI